MVFIPKTYPKAAGLQSEIGKVAVTQIAHWENDYRRQVQLAQIDMKRNIREIKHSRTRLHRSMLHYNNKLKEYKSAKENKYYQELLNERRAKNERRHLPVTLPPMEVHTEEVSTGLGTERVHLDAYSLDEVIEVTVPNEAEKRPIMTERIDSPAALDGFSGVTVANTEELAVEPVMGPLLFIDGKSLDVPGETKQRSSDPKSRTDNSKGPTTKDMVKATMTSDQRSTMTGLNTRTSDTTRKRKRKQGTSVTHIDIIKLQYATNVNDLFRAVEVLAKIHGVEAPKPEKRVIPDPRQKAQVLQTTQTSHQKTDLLTLRSDYLYNMRYGYTIPEESTDDNQGCDHVTPLIDYGVNIQSRTVSPRDSGRSSVAIHPILSPTHGFNQKNRENDPRITLEGGASSRSSSSKHPSVTASRDRKVSAKREHTNVSIRLPPIVATPSMVKAGKVVFHTQPRSLSDDIDERYIRRHKSTTENSVPWQTAFGILKNVHFLGKHGV